MNNGEALHDTEGVFRNAFDNAPIGVAVVDIDGRFLQVNRSLCELLGYSEAQLLQTTFQEITYAEDLDVSLSRVRRLLEGEIGSYSLEKRYVRADGLPVWVSLNVSLVRDQEDRPLYFVDQIQDITQRRMAEKELVRRAEELVRINAELETFAYSVSHDLRAPLRSVEGFAQILLEDYADSLDDEGKGYLARLGKNSRHMGMLIDDLLGLFHVTRKELRRDVVDLSAIARAIADELRLGEPDRAVDVRIARGLTGTGDAGLLEAALANLLGNAWKFTSRNPEARIDFGAFQRDAATVYFV